MSSLYQNQYDLMTMLDSDHKIRGSVDFINQHVGFRRWRYFKVKSGSSMGEKGLNVLLEELRAAMALEAIKRVAF